MSLYNTTLSQPFLFTAFVYIGILIGLLHSLFRCLRALFGKNRFVRIFSDILLLLLACGGFFYGEWMLTGLKMRGFHFLGAALGYALYAAAIRPLAVYINCKFRKKKIDNSSVK